MSSPSLNYTVGQTAAGAANTGGTAGATLDESTAQDSGLWAIMALFMWLTPHIFITIAEARWEIVKGYDWSGAKLDQGLKAITYHSMYTIVCWLLLVIVPTAALVAVYTDPLDLRMLYVLSGLSRLASAVILFLISVRIPRWFSVYYSKENVYEEPIGKDMRVLKFNIKWRISRHFFQMYFVMMPFFSGSTRSWGIPFSIIIGILGGVAVCLTVFFGRTTFKKRKRGIAIATAVAIVILSSAAFAGGVWYIQVVWEPQSTLYGQNVVYSAAILSWFFVGIAWHISVWRHTKRHVKEREERISRGEAVRSERFKTGLFNPKHFGDVTTAHGSTDATKTCGVLPAVAEENSPSNSISNGGGEEQENAHETKDNPDDNGVEMPPEQAENGPDGNDPDAEKQQTLLEIVPTGHDCEDEDDDAVTCCALFQGKVCCCCSRCNCTGYTMETEPMPPFEKFLMIIKWIIWVVCSSICLYVTIVNIGATTQANISKAKLSPVQTLEYANFTTGPVCAFNWSGTVPYDNTTDYAVRTFASPQAAAAANWTVAHCRPCGACSSWDIIGLQWTTRTFLAQAAQKCAKKLLFGGYEASLQCHEDTIGFDRACSECWVEDEICARDNCVFIYLQALIINNFGNFEVQPGTITSALCDEANCGPTFAPCAGAIRRRMNIKSDIARPAWQQCTIVDANMWPEFFGDPSPGTSKTTG